MDRGWSHSYTSNLQANGLCSSRFIACLLMSWWVGEEEVVGGRASVQANTFLLKCLPEYNLFIIICSSFKVLLWAISNSFYWTVFSEYHSHSLAWLPRRLLGTYSFDYKWTTHPLSIKTGAEEDSTWREDEGRGFFKNHPQNRQLQCIVIIMVIDFNSW